jgi:transposase
MFLRTHRRFKDGKDHTYWSLCETVRTPEGPRQRILCYLGELNGRQEARWRKTIQVFNHEGEEKQLSLFPSDHPSPEDDPNVVKIRLDRVAWERPRECGNVVMGLELWKRLEMDQFWEKALDEEPADIRWSSVAAILAVNRLLAPRSELSIEERWYTQTALDDLLGVPEEKVNTDRLYRALDLMLPHKEALEKHLRMKYGELFGADFELLLYDLTSTYFEGEAKANPQAQRGYSRDHRPDCKQVIIALVVSEEGFPIAYEVFDGNRPDVTTLEEILEAVETKYGKFRRIWVFDRGIVSEENLEILRKHGGQYLVGTPRSALRRFEKELLVEGWQEVREDVEVKLISIPGDEETYVLCRSTGRKEKESAIHVRQIQRLERHLGKLSVRISQGQIKDDVKIQRRIGAILARHPQVADLYEVGMERSSGKLSLVWEKVKAKSQWAKLREGHYLLRTNLKEENPQKLWEKYMQLVEAEAAFRALKSELAIRPIWHHKESRVQAHILVAFLGYALWVTLKHSLKRAGLALSPMKALHVAGKVQSGDILLETTDGRTLRLRRISRLDQGASELFRALKIQIPERLNRDLEWKCSADPKNSI